MSAGDTRDEKRYGEYHRQRASWEAKKRRRKQLRESVKGANEAIANGDYAAAGELLRDRVIPAIRKLDDVKPWSVYHRELHNDPDMAWHWGEFSRFLNDPDGTIEQARQRARVTATSLRNPITSETSTTDSARRVIDRALDTAESITAHHELTRDGMVSEADAMGFATKLGVHEQDPEMDFGDPVSAVSSDFGALKSLYGGGTSGGKSVGAARQMEDYYRSGVDGGRKYKCIDLAGLSSENIDAYDVPQQQKGLRHARKAHDLPPSFEEIDGYEPQAEIFVPLARGIDEWEFPYDTEADDWVPTPFTIPASDLSEGLLVSIINERVSDGVEQTIRSAFRALRNVDDWSLVDLRDEIAGRDELSDSNKKQAVRVVEDLQEMGFIRTHEHEHCLDWERIFRDHETITVFNQMVCESDLAKFVLVAYLLDQVWERRILPNSYPNLALWLRELWEYAPHQGIRRRRDDAVQAVQEWIIHRVTSIQRKPRDINTHVVADTQDPTDIERSVRTLFNRYAVFSGTSAGTLNDIFDWAGQKGAGVLQGTLQSEPGVAGLVGAVGPAVGDSNLWGISPVKLTPPSWHHHDKDDGSGGWERRVEIMDVEELRECDWDASVPEALQVTQYDPDAEDGGDEDDDVDPDQAMAENKDYHRAEARNRRKSGESLREIARNLPENPDTGRPYDPTTIMRWCSDIEPGEDGD